MTKKNKGLGQGLAALLRDVDEVKQNTSAAATASKDTPGYAELSVDELGPSPYQPRKAFGEEELSSLADSIKEAGVIQPLLVRIMPDGSRQLVAGERRLRAARMAGMKVVPAILQKLSDKKARAYALMENMQRQDLSPIEEAEGIFKMSKEGGLSQEEIATLLSKSRSQIANILRLNKLPDEVKEMLDKGKISVGAARLLIGDPDAIELAKVTVKNQLGVRELEQWIDGFKKDREDSLKSDDSSENMYRAEPPKEALPEMLNDKDLLEESLSKSLGMKVRLAMGVKKHLLSIEFKTMDQLDFLLNQLDKNSVKNGPVHKSHDE